MRVIKLMSAHSDVILWKATNNKWLSIRTIRWSRTLGRRRRKRHTHRRERQLKIRQKIKPMRPNWINKCLWHCLCPGCVFVCVGMRWQKPVHWVFAHLHEHEHKPNTIRINVIVHACISTTHSYTTFPSSISHFSMHLFSIIVSIFLILYLEKQYFFFVESTRYAWLRSVFFSRIIVF